MLLVNAYILYQHAHICIWKMKAGRLLTHYKFQKMVALHWINPELYPIASGGEMDGVKRHRLNTNSSTITLEKSCQLQELLLSMMIHFCRVVFCIAAYPQNSSTAQLIHLQRIQFCSLHYWASGESSCKHWAQVMTCDC